MNDTTKPVPPRDNRRRATLTFRPEQYPALTAWVDANPLLWARFLRDFLENAIKSGEIPASLVVGSVPRVTQSVAPAPAPAAPAQPREAPPPAQAEPQQPAPQPTAAPAAESPEEVMRQKMLERMQQGNRF